MWLLLKYHNQYAWFFFEFTHNLYKLLLLWYSIIISHVHQIDTYPSQKVSDMWMFVHVIALDIVHDRGTTVLSKESATFVCFQFCDNLCIPLSQCFHTLSFCCRLIRDKKHVNVLTKDWSNSMLKVVGIKLNWIAKIDLPKKDRKLVVTGIF